MVYIAPIVEGQGEQQAVPTLLFRLSEYLGVGVRLVVNPPIRIKSGSFLHDEGYFSRYVAMAAAKAAANNGIVLILLDCDDGCPAHMGPEILSMANKVRNDVAYLVVLAYREFESWFIHGLSPLRGSFGISQDLERPADIARIRDAKGWLGSHMDSGYDPVSHQNIITRQFDLDEAKECQSFNRLCLKLEAILRSAV